MTIKPEERCMARVFKRDTYRVNRGTKSGFRTHYTECQCSRRRVTDKYCRQHTTAVYVVDCRWATR